VGFHPYRIDHRVGPATFGHLTYFLSDVVVLVEIEHLGEGHNPSSIHPAYTKGQGAS
jgi:hypothetical protein